MQVLGQREMAELGFGARLRRGRLLDAGREGTAAVARVRTENSEMRNEAAKNFCFVKLFTS